MSGDGAPPRLARQLAFLVELDKLKTVLRRTSLIDGVPVLAVEILSPRDTQEEIDEKIEGYLQAGVHLVWVIDAHDQTVTIYRPGAAPELVNVNQELAGEPELPGFRVPAAQLFV